MHEELKTDLSTGVNAFCANLKCCKKESLLTLVNYAGQGSVTSHDNASFGENFVLLLAGFLHSKNISDVGATFAS